MWNSIFSDKVVRCLLLIKNKTTISRKQQFYLVSIKADKNIFYITSTTKYLMGLGVASEWQEGIYL